MAHPSSAALRLMSDLKHITQEPPEGASASPLSENNLFVWGATIFGPEDTPWEGKFVQVFTNIKLWPKGGIFSLRMTFPETYPDRAPKVRFITEIYHPNGNIVF